MPRFPGHRSGECIDCALCVAECPASAIFAEDEAPDGQRGFIGLDAELCKIRPLITGRRIPLDAADAWNGISDKPDRLER
jgi:ferredoxin